MIRIRVALVLGLIIGLMVSVSSLSAKEKRDSFRSPVIVNGKEIKGYLTECRIPVGTIDRVICNDGKIYYSEDVAQPVYEKKKIKDIRFHER
jgi:hypothetical protein